MIHFCEIANPPTPMYKPMCGVCDGRGVVPSLSTKSVISCDKCNGTGKQLQKDLSEGAELQNADGVAMTQAEVDAFLLTLP